MPRKDGMKPIHILVTENQREQITEFAKDQKFKTTSDYLRALIEDSMKAKGVEIDLSVNRGGYRGSKEE